MGQFAKIKPAFVVAIILAIFPLFWLKPGEMDLGGDASRLYFYDPINYLKNFSLYSITPYGIGEVRPDFYNLPLLLIFIAVKQLTHSSTFLISILNSIKFVVGFFAVYAIVKEFIYGHTVRPYITRIIETAAILAGLFYVLSPGMITNLHRALLSHNQIFLNPLMFYLMLRFFLTSRISYLFGALMVSFIFSHNFSYAAAPPFFSFYPLSLLFLIIYVGIIRRKALPWKKMLIGVFIFFGLQAFHLVPELINILDSQSHANTRVFDVNDIAAQVTHFWGSVGISNIKVISGIIGQAPFYESGWVSFVIPLIIIFGFLQNRKKEKAYILTGIFFLIALFLATAKVSYLGVEFYSKLFYIPGFSMFRNFWNQWAFIYSFFYALLFGQALFFIFSRLSKSRALLLFTFLTLAVVINGWQIINGQIINQILLQTKDIKTAQVWDPKYEETLSFIRSIPTDSKILTLPFSDCCYQVIHGTNNGAYVGMSTIPYLAGKKDFSGHGFSVPYSQAFFDLAKSKDYKSFKKMLGFLNIQYIFHNSDPKIYDTTFPGYPYSPDYSRKYFPQDQNGYKEFIENLVSDKIFEKGYYTLYSVNKESFLPHFYIPKHATSYVDNPSYGKYGVYGKALSFLPIESNGDTRMIYMEKKSCESQIIGAACNTDFSKVYLPKITFKKINPTKYIIQVFDATQPYILVFSEAFNKNWRIFISSRQPQETEVTQSYFNSDIKEGKHVDTFFDSKTFETLGIKDILQDSHFAVNAYANAWYITTQDVGKRKNYELIVELTAQRRFYFSLSISIVVFVGFIIWGSILFHKSLFAIISRWQFKKREI